MKMKRGRTLVAVTAATLLLVACGDGDDAQDGAQDGPATAAPVGHEDYLAALEERCQQTNEDISAVEEANQGESPEEAVAYLNGFADAIEGFVTETRELEPPAEDAEAAAGMYTALEDAVTAFRTAAEGIGDDATMEDIEAAAGPAFGSLGPAEAAAGELGLSLQSCGEEAVEPDPDATQVAVTATDYAFEVPEVSAGATAFVMTNEGAEPHFMYVVRLKEAGTLEDALAAEEAGQDPEAFIEEEIGESQTASPDGTAVLNADLSPGAYAMLCFVSNAEGVPHVALGMAQEFTVS